MASTSSSKLSKNLSTLGYCILPEVLSYKECDALKIKLDHLHQKYSSLHASNVRKPSHGSQTGDKVLYNLQNKDKVFLKFLDRGLPYKLVKGALQTGSYQNSEQVTLRQAVARSPVKGIPTQQLHIDSRFPGCTFPIALVIFWLLDDSSANNGATWVVPRSHKKTTYPVSGKKYSGEIQLEAPKGSAIIMDGGVWHAGGQNLTEDTRWALIFTYVRWFVKPAFDFNKNMPAHLYSSLTSEQKRILGYHTNPPIDEFTRITSRTEAPDIPLPYCLPVTQ